MVMKNYIRFDRFSEWKVVSGPISSSSAGAVQNIDAAEFGVDVEIGDTVKFRHAAGSSERVGNLSDRLAWQALADEIVTLTWY
jgi:hypothetical protein